MRRRNAKEEDDDNVSDGESEGGEPSHAPRDADSDDSSEESEDSGSDDEGEEGETGGSRKESKGLTAAKQAGSYSVYSLGCRWQGCTKQFGSAMEAREHEKDDHVLASNGTVCLIAGCGKEYDTHSKLVRHSIAHRERQFTCEDCGKKFVYSWDLKRHQFLHTGERPFQCPIPGCGRSFTKSTNCDAHLANDHKEPDREARIAFSTGDRKSSSKSKKSKSKKKAMRVRKKRPFSEEEHEESNDESSDQAAARAKSSHAVAAGAAAQRPRDHGKIGKRRNRSRDRNASSEPMSGELNPISMMGFGMQHGGLSMRSMPLVTNPGAVSLGAQMIPGSMIPGLPMAMMQAPPGYMAQPMIAFVPAPPSHDPHTAQTSGAPGPPIQFQHPGIMYSYHAGQFMQQGHVPYQYQIENMARPNQPMYQPHSTFAPGHHMMQTPQNSLLHPGVVSPPLPSQPRSRQIGNLEANGALRKDQGPSTSKE